MIPIELQVIGASLRAIAEEMGAVLIRSAFSANIKERRDCSTALFDERGRMVTQAEHIPVHLGAMPEAVAAVMAHDPAPGEPWILNDPYAGGTHLPDLTIVTRTELGYAVTRAHHADVGGSEPGSLPPGSRTLDEEGVIIPPTRLDDAAVESLVSRMRNPDERRGDLRAQLAGNRLAESRIAELCERRGRDRVAAAMDELLAYSERVVRAAIRELPDGRFVGEDVLETREGLLPIRAAVTIAGDTIDIDFDGNRAAVRRQPQLPARRDALGVLLRRPLPDRSRPPRLGRRVRPGDGARARRLARQRALAGSRRGREHGDVEPHHRRRLRRLRAGDPRARAGPGHDEQHRARERPLHVLRDDRRRSGRVPGRGRAVGRPRRDVEHVQHARRGARALVPAPRRALRAPPRLGRQRVATAAATASCASCGSSSAAASRCSRSAARSRRAARAAATTACPAAAS